MIALDTNILGYAVTKSDTKGRHDAAISLLEKLSGSGAIIPLPVFGEFFNACRKQKLAAVEMAELHVDLWLDLYDCPPPQAEDYTAASRLTTKHKLQYFDALIITVAARAGATVLLSEDMHDGLEIEGLRVANPFVAGNAGLLWSAT